MGSLGKGVGCDFLLLRATVMRILNDKSPTRLAIIHGRLRLRGTVADVKSQGDEYLFAVPSQLVESESWDGITSAVSRLPGSVLSRSSSAEIKMSVVVSVCDSSCVSSGALGLPQRLQNLKGGVSSVPHPPQNSRVAG